MTRSRTFLAAWFTALAAIAASLACGMALADPPGRAARLSQISGAVSFSPAGEDDWVFAQPNRPLITGDRVWADNGARAELQIGTAALRLGSATSVALLNLDDRIVQIDLAQGTVNVHVRLVYPEQVYEIDTPNLAFSIRRSGDYRVDVDPAGNSTLIRVRGGEGEAWGEGAAYTVSAGQQATFVGEGLRDYSFDAMSAPDPFDDWCLERNRREESAVAARYVSPDVVGYSDLDEYGTWRPVEGYGNAWFPSAVPGDWVPYRNGQWAWVDPWGWTWIDQAPWGFAPFHYGRWAYVSSRWCWVPGPVAVRPVYAPALVAFVGGGGFSLSLSTGPVAGIAWFPLGPGDVYRPSYAVSRNYFTSINVSNTVINTTVVNNVYNNVNVTNIAYRNRGLPGAVTAVPTAAFTGAQPVAGHLVAVSPAELAREPVSPVAALAPSRASVLAVAAVAAGAGVVAVARHPPAAVLTRPVVAKTAPPPQTPSFAAQASLLAAHPGVPLQAEQLKSVQPAHAVESTKVKLVAPAVAPQPLSKGGGQGARLEHAATRAPGSAAAVPQPPQERAMQEHKAPPSGAAAPQPPAASERLLKDNRAAPAAAAPQPPNERFKQESKGPAANVAAPQPGNQHPKQEAKGPPPSAPVPQPPPKERAVRQPATAAPQERVEHENKAGLAPKAPAPPQERAQKAAPPPPPPPPQKAQKAAPKPGPEENKAKDKEHKEGQ